MSGNKIFAIIMLVFFASTVYALGCNPGTSQCYNETAYQTCGEHALWNEPIDCQIGQSCIDGACQEPVGCNPGTRECTSDTTYKVCGQYAIWESEKSCNSGWTCANGQCIAPKPVPQCSTPGQARCAPDGSNTVQVCNNDLQWVTQRTCDYGCYNGACKGCNPGSTRCSDGTHFLTCNSDGVWTSETYCGNGRVCQGGACTNDPSTSCQSVGALRCSPTNSNMLQKCASNYVWADSQVCQMGCYYNACRACSTGEKLCKDTQSYYTCNDRWQWDYLASCPQGYTCFMGVCQVPTSSQCTSVGQKRCSLNDTTMVQMCGSNYAYSDYTRCAIGCYNGECMQCQTGETQCADSSSYKICGTNGQFADAVACPTGQACSGGKCAPVAVCTESARQCNGNEIQVCKGGQWALYTTCSAASTCAEAQGTAYCKDNVQPPAEDNKTSGQAQQQEKQPDMLPGIAEGALGVIVLLAVAGGIYYLFAKHKRED